MLRSCDLVVILSSTSEEDNADAGEETLDILAGSADEATSAEMLLPAGRKRRLLEDTDAGSAAGVAAVEARGPSRRKAKAPKRAQTEAEATTAGEPAAADTEPHAEPAKAAGPASPFAQQAETSSKQPADGTQWMRLSAAVLAPAPQTTPAAQLATASARRDAPAAPDNPADAPQQSLPAGTAPPLGPVASAPTPLPSSPPRSRASPAAAFEAFKAPPSKPAAAALDHAASAPAADASAHAGARSQSAAGPSLDSWLGSRPPRAAAPVQGQLREDGRMNAAAKKPSGSGSAAASGTGAAGKRKGQQTATAPPAKKKAKQAKKAPLGGGTVKEDVAKRENEMRELAKQFADDAGAALESVTLPLPWLHPWHTPIRCWTCTLPLSMQFRSHVPRTNANLGASLFTVVMTMSQAFPCVPNQVSHDPSC